jgi:hypothetical protein
MEEKDKPKVPKVGGDIKKKTAAEERLELSQLIIKLTEQKSIAESRFNDDRIDRERDKVQLLGGAEISLKQIRQLIAGKLNEYDPPFRVEWYEQVFRLNGWPVENAKDFIKPAEVADYTNEVIYGRFPKGILPVLQKLNPFVGLNVRAHKNYQYLTVDGYNDVVKYIDQSHTMMKDCKTWYEFRMRYSKEYGVYFQSQMFIL